MDLRLLFFNVISCVLFANLCFAADVSGQWKAIAEVDGQDAELVFTIQQLDNNRITGTFKAPKGEQKISEGFINGEDISFVVHVEEYNFDMKFKGKIVGDKMKLLMSNPISDNNKINAVRVKQ